MLVKSCRHPFFAGHVIMLAHIATINNYSESSGKPFMQTSKHQLICWIFGLRICALSHAG